MHQGKQWKMTHVLGTLPPLWRWSSRFLGHCSHLGGWDQWVGDLSFWLSFSLTLSCTYINQSLNQQQQQTKKQKSFCVHTVLSTAEARGMTRPNSRSLCGTYLFDMLWDARWRMEPVFGMASVFQNQKVASSCQDQQERKDPKGDQQDLLIPGGGYKKMM